jgi:hypothetical protein
MPLVFGRRIHARRECQPNDPSTESRVGMLVDDCRGHQEHGAPILHCHEIHVAEYVPEEGVGDEPLGLLVKADDQKVSPIVAHQHMTSFDLQCQAEAEDVFQMGLDVAALIVSHWKDGFEPATGTKHQQFCHLELGKAAELDVAQYAHP